MDKITLQTEKILGLKVVSSDISICMKSILGCFEKRQKSYFVACLNPHSEVTSRKDPFFRNALEKVDFLLPDGFGIVLASRLLGGTIKMRITGSDLFYLLTRSLDRKFGVKYFFLGSTEDVLLKINNKMKNQYPNIRVCGSYSPPFKDTFSAEENDKIIEIINRSCADVLWVGMSAPKQEKWIASNLERINAPVVVAVGAVFDFYAGTVRRSNPVFQRIGLEWLPRLFQDPKRLWRRMGISAPLFLWRILLERTKSRK